MNFELHTTDESIVYTPSGARIFKGSERYYLYDQSQYRFRSTCGVIKPESETHVLASVSDDSILVFTTRQILRLTFGSQEREVLFPR